MTTSSGEDVEESTSVSARSDGGEDDVNGGTSDDGGNFTDDNDNDNSEEGYESDDEFDLNDYPQTMEGLRDLLESIVDRDCPFDDHPQTHTGEDGGHGDNGNGNEGLEHEYEVNKTATYQATEIRVDASSKRQIPIPIFAANSVVKWRFYISERDIGFGIFHQNQNAKAKDDGKDNHNHSRWLVESSWAYASENKKVDADGNDVDDEDEEEDSEEGAGATNLASSSTFTFPTTVTQHGEFILPQNQHGDEQEVMSFPTTIVLEFDNTYSWITEKTVSYCVTVIPPSNPKVVERSKRAKKLLDVVTHQISQLHHKCQFQKAIQKQAEKDIQTSKEELNKTQQEAKEYETQLSQVEKQLKEVETKKKKLSDKIERNEHFYQKNIFRLEQIEQFIWNLQDERRQLFNEQKEIEEENADQKKELETIVTADYDKVTSQKKQIDEKLCELNIDVLMKEEATMDIEQSIKDLQTEEIKSKKQIEYYQTQLIKEIQKRIIWKILSYIITN